MPTTTTANVNRVLSELARLDVDERAISRSRRQLHRRIDRLYLSAPLDDEHSLLLLSLENRERTISRERRALHEQIDELRASIGLPSWREVSEASEAEAAP